MTTRRCRSLTYVVLPGVPMDFLNATARASWGFIRNQDDRYGVKVVAEEAISLKWQVDEYSYSVPGNFRRLKELGFETRDDLARFFEFLPALVEVTEYDLDHRDAAERGRTGAVGAPDGAGSSAESLKDSLSALDRAGMDGRHARRFSYCNVSPISARPRATGGALRTPGIGPDYAGGPITRLDGARLRYGLRGRVRDSRPSRCRGRSAAFPSVALAA
jgi:hypothetical protein